jgi:hypothetical protein
MPKLKVTADLIAAAIAGYEVHKDHIESKIAELQAILYGHRIPAGVSPHTPTRMRTLSAAARKRIADAQKKRWAAYRKKSKQAQEPIKKKTTAKKAALKAVKKAAVKRAAVKKSVVRATMKSAANQAGKRRAKPTARKAAKESVTLSVPQAVEQKTTVEQGTTPETTA